MGTFADRATDLCTFIAASPTPHHAVAHAVERLEAGGFHVVDEASRWPDTAGGYVVVRGGALIAWRRGASIEPTAGIRIVGAHTDSPNLRLKPHPDADSGRWHKVAVEPYGGVLWNSWLDRDLGLAGRLLVRPPTGGPPEPVLVRVDEPWLRIPQLAIHLDRTVNTDGLRLDPARHLDPVWGLRDGEDAPGIVAAVADRAGCDPTAIVAVELMCHDLTPPAVTGFAGEFVSSARIDNQLSCWAAVQALLEAPTTSGQLPMICLFDHEEVGSQSATGADSRFAADVINRIAGGAGLDVEDEVRLRACSWAVSADGAHATHPNRPEVHDPRHLIDIDGGPVVKHNANQRYATTPDASAWLGGLAGSHGIPLQHFSMRNDLACGSTIGPLNAAALGIPTVDVGVAQLAMHSAREMCGSLDAARFVTLLTAALSA